jgi:hypothetical protein
VHPYFGFEFSFVLVYNHSSDDRALDDGRLGTDAIKYPALLREIREEPRANQASSEK